MSKSSLSLVAGLLFLGTAMSGCVPKPKQDYSVDQLKQIDSLEELMKVQAAAADPQFGKLGQATLSDQEFAAMADAAQRLEETAKTIVLKFSTNRPPTFVAYAQKLSESAATLRTVATAKDVAQANAAISSIRDTCRGCHKEHR